MINRRARYAPWCVLLGIALVAFPALVPRAEAQNAANYTATDLLPDGTALVPLNEWMPIFGFSMTFSIDAPAPRMLAEFVFRLIPDPAAGERTYNLQQIIPSDIYQFAIFEETGPNTGVLNNRDRIVKGRAGGPFAGQPLIFDVDGNLLLGGTLADSDSNPLSYAFDLRDWDITSFIDDISTLPDNPVDNDPNNAPAIRSGRFILAVRTSATWRNTCSFAYDHSLARMRLFDGTFPVGDDGAPIDSYAPNFPELEILNPETAYSSSFAVWDISSGPLTNIFNPEFANAWAHPRFLYTPQAEYSRPRFDVAGSAFDFVTGEFIDLRRLFPLEQWMPVIGINLHGAPAPRQQFYPNETGGPWFGLIDGGPATIKEVNVIFTDIGGDPNGPAGNGGFNPMQGFETFTQTIVGGGGSGSFNPDLSSLTDYSYNGVNVFHDTNENGFFDQPALIGGTNGVGFAGLDYPIFPEGSVEGLDIFEQPDDINPGVARWEYVPFPPGGGDPWWKLRLRLSTAGRRRLPEQTPTGYLDAVPDGNREDFFTGFVSDYFVVIRPDSGYADSRGLPGDGVGLTYGADFRAFIEPRRFNPNSGTTDGGIYVSNMIPEDSLIGEGVYLSAAWQDDSQWGLSEPWWPSRTLNETNAKPIRSTVEVHDLVMTYETNSFFAKITDTDYGFGLGIGDGDFTANPIFFANFSRWLDPFGLRSTQFQDVHSVGVVNWVGLINGVDDDVFNSWQYPYETVPFFQPDNDLPPFGPRSAFLPVPPAQPTLPDYSTWPGLLLPGEFPNESQWALANRRARYLKQHIEASSRATAMIGLNFAGGDDPVVNQFAQIRLQQLTVAFWGPDFTPSDLLPLDPNGTSTSSGVQLVEDGVPDPNVTQDPPVYLGQDGVFGPAFGPVPAGSEFNFDTPVRVSGLQWRPNAELIDLNGDGVADDLNGDGTVNDADKAWVLQFRPSTPWRLPVIDAPGGNFPIVPVTPTGLKSDSDHEVTFVPADEEADPETRKKERLAKSRSVGPSKKTARTMTFEDTLTEHEVRHMQTKAFGPAGNAGDDLFVIVRTSDSISRFEQFRCLVPSTLPERPANQRQAGIQLLPQTPISLAVYDKIHPEETVAAPYYGPEPFGFDLIEANVAAKIIDLTGTGQTIVADSGDVAVLGLDISTNRGNSVGTAASGQTGTGSAGAFTVTGAGWQANAFTDYFLIDSRFRAFRITGNTSTKLNLEGGTPNNGPWRIVRDPTFLEQLIVEFYDVGRDGGFNIVDDLLPLENSANSGVKIYRDNDNAPGNQNGVFDETDILVELDYPPFLIGQAGEPDTQVMFIFSTPGTDNIPQNIANQPTRRQWVPDTFLAEGGDNAAVGSDFFVVIQTSETLDIGDDFRVGIVSWGPNTPTEPDPDTFPPPPATRVGEFDVFSEFPWGARAIGLITFFKSNDLPQYDKYKYYKQYPELDNSGFNWVRSTVNKAAQTRTILASEVVVSPTDVVITSVTPTQLPKNVPSGGITLAIAGQNFGASPTADIDGVALIIVSSTNTSIIATIPGNTVLDQDGDLKVTLRVTNTQTGRNGKFSNFTIITGGTGEQPTITSINPTQGTRNDFPVTITGTNFDDPVVRFEGTVMPIQGTPTSTTIVVAFPTGGLPQTGPLDVTVQNQTSGLLAVKPDGFTYINSPTGGGGGGFGGGGGLPTCFIATAAYGTPFEGRLATFRGFRDDVLLKTALGAALVDAYYTLSPPMADAVAQSPVLAGAARILLTPVAWMIEFPVCAGIGAALLLTFLAIRVTRARPVRQRVMAGAPRDIK